MGLLNKLRNNIPFLHRLFVARYRAKMKKKDTESVFTEIFSHNSWGDKDSLSGSGSNLVQTEKLINELPGLLKNNGIGSMLDVPCGDFHWMKQVNLDDIRYTGGDIVKELVDNDNKMYSGENRHFIHLNLIQDDLPVHDLIFCRDCLVHFSYRDIFNALKNISESDCTYLLTTTFPDRTENRDIITGEWRPLNLTIAPFNLPEPLELINENCTEMNGIYADKSMGLWRIRDIAKVLK